MSRYRVELISSVPGLPAGAEATITDTYHGLFETLEAAQTFTEIELRQPPGAHTGQVVEVSTGEVVWKTGPDTR